MSPGAEAMPTAAQVKILLVDDNASNLLVLEAILAELGQALVRARSGGEALRRLLDDDFAVILMDVQMPGMSGFEAAELIRGRDRSRYTPIIFLTAYEHNDLEVFRGYSVGAVDFLFKPVVPEVLRSKVRIFVELFQKTEQIARQSEQLRENERRELERQLAEERQRAEAERMQMTMSIAQEVQRKFFPTAPPSCPGYDICGASHPAEVTGGDYYDYLTLPDGALAIVVGDVCGHGFGPALLMSATRAYLRALLLTNSRVGAIMPLLNRALVDDVDDGRFVTLALARLDPGSRSLVYSSAGHNEGYVLTPSGEVRSVLDSTGPPLGVLVNAEFPESPAIALEPGEIVLLLTDGVLEASSPDQLLFGHERALDVVRLNRSRPACEIIEALYQAVRTFTRNNTLFDDVTCLVVKVEGDTGGR